MWYVKTRLWYVILLKYLKKICAMVYDHSSKSDIYLSAPFRQFMPSPTYILFNIGLTLSAVSCWPKNYTLFLGIRQNFPSSWPAWDSQRNEFTVHQYMYWDSTLLSNPQLRYIWFLPGWFGLAWVQIERIVHVDCCSGQTAQPVNQFKPV